MKSKTVYCDICEDNCKHDRERRFTGFWRGYLAVFTLGVNEVVNNVLYTCTECGTVTEYDS